MEINKIEKKLKITRDKKTKKWWVWMKYYRSVYYAGSYSFNPNKYYYIKEIAKENIFNQIKSDYHKK